MHVLYVYVKKGAAFKPGDLGKMGHALRADYQTLPNGDAFGKVVAITAEARTIMEADPNIIVSPPLHRPLKQQHVDVFKNCGVAVDTTHTGYDLGEMLHAQHKTPFWHPENWQVYVTAAEQDAEILEPDEVPPGSVQVAIGPNGQKPSGALPSSS